MAKKRPELSQVDGEPPSAELFERFGANFRDIRKEAGLTQAQVAGLSGIEQTEISKIERGQVNLTLAKMQRLAKVVDHDVSVILSTSSELPSRK